jgi:hypothetical protein
MTIISIPLSGVPMELREQIEKFLPKPISVPGWKFSAYRWRKLTQINTKDKNGNTDNTVRVAGTSDNETLEMSLRSGIDVNVQTPSIYPNDNLINGFHRLKTLKKIGYKEWIFAEYVRDESTSTEFQETFEEALDDARASMNKGNGQKVISESEIEEIVRKRFENRPNNSKDKIKEYITTLDLNLSPQKIEGIATKVSRDYSRRGVVESFSRKEAQEFLEELGIGADLLNTCGIKFGEGDPTRVLRLLYQVILNFVKNENTMNIALYDSQASSHPEIFGNRENTIKVLDHIDDLILEYAYCRMKSKNRNIKPYEIIGTIPQVLGVENISEVKKTKRLIQI